MSADMEGEWLGIFDRKTKHILRKEKRRPLNKEEKKNEELEI